MNPKRLDTHEYSPYSLGLRFRVCPPSESCAVANPPTSQITCTPCLGRHTLYREYTPRTNVGAQPQPRLLCSNNPTTSASPKGPKYLYGTKYGLCSSKFPYGLGKYSPYGYLGPFGFLVPLGLRGIESAEKSSSQTSMPSLYVVIVITMNPRD